MLEYKEVLGILSLLTGLTATIYYITEVLKENIKPAPFSWIIWSLVMSTIFFAQQTNNAGAGSWVTGVGALTSFAIFLLALKKTKKQVQVKINH